jgi:hypothetical protein
VAPGEGLVAQEGDEELVVGGGGVDEARLGGMV